jgi:hypothetical protein
MFNFILNRKSNLSLSIASIFRNNEDYLCNHYLPNIKILKKRYKDINFYFYTDGNQDNTSKILKTFCKNNSNTFLKIGENKKKVYPRDTSLQRVQNIVNARNQLLKLRPFTNEYTIIIDSDIYFDIRVIERLAENIEPNYCGLFSNGIDQNYFNETQRIHYYDVLAFIDLFENYGYERFVENGFAENPFAVLEDETSWKEGKITAVKSAFGGMGIYRSEILNKFIEYDCIKTFKVMKNRQKLYADHWSLNFFANSFGPLGVDPLAKVYHYSF